MRVISSVDFSIVEIDGKIRYRLNEGFTYHSTRYSKSITLEDGYPSDGATDAVDIASIGWWVHDKLCDTGEWDDGTKLSNWQCSQVLQDIMVEESPSGVREPGASWKEQAAAKWERYRPSSRYWQAKRWFWATWLFGGGQARKNGMLAATAMLALMLCAGCSTVNCTITGDGNHVTIEQPKTVTASPYAAATARDVTAPVPIPGL